MKICKKAKHVLLLLWAIVRVSVLCDSHTDTDTAHPSLPPASWKMLNGLARPVARWQAPVSLSVTVSSIQLSV